MKDWYFTFGIGDINSMKYVRITASSYDAAREEMFNRYGSKWAFQYSEEEWQNDEMVAYMRTTYKELEHLVAKEDTEDED